jgi:hypothetical protein
VDFEGDSYLFLVRLQQSDLLVAPLQTVLLVELDRPNMNTLIDDSLVILQHGLDLPTFFPYFDPELSKDFRQSKLHQKS